MSNAPPEVESFEAMLRGDSEATREVFEGERKAAGRLLSTRAAREVPALVLEACARLEPAVEHFQRIAPPACARCCSFCCRGVRVEATVPEVIAIADFVREGRSPDEARVLAREAAESAAAVRDLDSKARWTNKTPCRFLDTRGQCSVYPVRPLACRSAASFDAGECERATADPTAQATIPRHMAPARIFGTAKSAIVAACEEAGLDGRRFELTSAFAVAMNEPDAAERWLRGERLFDAALLPSDERDRVEALRALKKQGLIAPERLALAGRTRPEKNVSKRERRARRSKDR
jgi:Fe-S-cluster containining protein